MDQQVSAMLFPSEPAQLTDQWLTEALRHGGAISESAVIGHERELVAQQGAAGVVARLTLAYDRPEAGAPDTVVAKFASSHPPIRAIMHRFGMYRAEVEFYRQLGADAGIPIPRCYYADIDATSGCFVLLFEDMCDARGTDPLAPAIADVEIAVDHLAPFHAKWWGSPRLREFTWLTYPEGPAFDARVSGLQHAFAGAAQAVRSKLGSAFPAVLSRACDLMLGDWRRYVRSRLTSPLTLTHRDFHGQQIFYPSERGGRFAVIDWQTVAIGPGADDLSRIVSMGLARPERAAHQDDLMARYHAGLEAAGVAGYTMEQCVRDFRSGLTASLTTNIVAAASIDLSVFAAYEAEAGVSFVYAVFDRLAAAFEDNDVLALLA